MARVEIGIIGRLVFNVNFCIILVVICRLVNELGFCVNVMVFSCFRLIFVLLSSVFIIGNIYFVCLCGLLV